MEHKEKRKVVLIGTYWTGQFSKWKGYYNYPIEDDDVVDLAACSDICELWLFKGTQRLICRTASFIGVKTKKELVSDYRYKPQKGSRHKRYLLFKTEILYTPSEMADKVIVRLSDFVKRSPEVWAQLKAYLESPDRNDPRNAKLLPRILVGIPPERLCVCEAALKYEYGASPCIGTITGPTIDPDFERDIQESDIPLDILEMLLKDQTTGDNIRWLTDNYENRESELGKQFKATDFIVAADINQPGNKVIRPRVDKSREEQRSRVVGKAEVFTPSWICNAMNNLVDKAWFGLDESPFTVEGQKSWKSNKEKLPFRKDKDWKTYVSETRLEITCGEAPFLVSRYDTTTGNVIEIPERIGILDRKLRAVTENVGVKEPKKWLEWARVALQNTLGYEWQGDNLLLARENVLDTILEYYKYYCHSLVDHAELLELARIVSWNLWQMDGLKFVVPNSCHPVPVVRDKPKFVQGDLFAAEPAPPDHKPKQLPLEIPCPGCAKKNPLDGAHLHNGIYCKIMNWETGEPEEFHRLLNTKEVGS